MLGRLGRPRDNAEPAGAPDVSSGADAAAAAGFNRPSMIALDDLEAIQLPHAHGDPSASCRSHGVPPVMQEGNPRRHYYLAVTPWIRIMTTALRYLWRPQAECEARKIARAGRAFTRNAHYARPQRPQDRRKPSGEPRGAFALRVSRPFGSPGRSRAATPACQRLR